MGFFDRLKSAPKNFLEPRTVEANLQKQLAATPQIVAQLRALGVTTETSLKLEFFFYTNTVDKAIALASALSDLDYDVEQKVSASQKSLRVTTGWSTAMQMKDDVVGAWAEQMCRLGSSHDCEFDGWGTNPTQ